MKLRLRDGTGGLTDRALAEPFGTGDTAHDFVGQVYRVSGALLSAFLIARAISPETDRPSAGYPP